MKALILYLIFFSIFAIVNIIYGQTEELDYERFMDYIATDDAFSRIIGFDYFDKTVPDSEKATALSRTWELAKDRKDKSAIQKSILSYFISHPQESELWSEEMKNNVLSISSDKDPVTRKLCLNALSSRADSSLDSSIVKFLNDDDEIIRENAIIMISKWSNGKTVLQDYMIKNRDNKTLEKSLQKAKFLIEKKEK